MTRSATPPPRARDLRLAVLGGCCTSLGAACLLLAACATTSPRPESAPPLLPVAPALRQPDMAVAEFAAPDVATPALQSPWPHLRATFVLPTCGYNAAVRRWTRAYAQNPRDFSRSLARAMPSLLFVAEQLARYRIPGEFAFLPYLESNYVPIAPNGDRAAGIWQLMPDTALDSGLRMDAEYDGRLDTYAATITAIGLLRQYHAEFGDWRIADMAFNAGMYGMRQLVARNAHAGDWTAHELAALGANAGAQDHLAKLLALACIVSEPARFHVRLPEPRRDDRLALLELPAPADLQLVAHLARMDLAQLRRLNPGLMRGRVPATGPFHLLLPATRRAAVERTLARLPQYVWRDWHEVVLKQSETLDLFAMLGDIDAVALGEVNGRGADVTLPAGTRLLLPGTTADTDNAVADNAPPPVAEAPDSTVIRSGDTLSEIAHRYGLQVDDLLRWNKLTRDTTLRLGQQLLLNAPDGS
jgi:membrane-bound lytic murein transglycosylase D